MIRLPIVERGSHGAYRWLASRPAAAAALLLVFLTLGFGYLLLRAPPPVIVKLPQSPSLLRVYPAVDGAYFILPDGSLWRWGKPERNTSQRASVPLQVGTNRDWMMISSVGQTVGVRSNGTLWELHGSVNSPRVQPFQVSGDSDWVSASATFSFALARKRNGTLWAWGDNSRYQLGIGISPTNSVSIPIQVGTNQDWLDASAYDQHSLGLRADGTLWVWGGVPVESFGMVMTLGGEPGYSFPTQAGTRTDWVGLAHDGDLARLARNQAGELWDLLSYYYGPSYTAPSFARSYLSSSSPASYATPSPSGLNGRLMATKVSSDHLAFGYGGPSAFRNRFVIHADSTLWFTPFNLYPITTTPPAYMEKWQKFGRRNDWVSVWGAYGTTYGLTSDGTLWMWGLDYSCEPRVDLKSRLTQAWAGLAKVLRLSSNISPPSGPTTPWQKTPRPILRIVPAKTD